MIPRKNTFDLSFICLGDKILLWYQERTLLICLLFVLVIRKTTVAVPVEGHHAACDGHVHGNLRRHAAEYNHLLLRVGVEGGVVQLFRSPDIILRLPGQVLPTPGINQQKVLFNPLTLRNNSWNCHLYRWYLRDNSRTKCDFTKIKDQKVLLKITNYINLILRGMINYDIAPLHAPAHDKRTSGFTTDIWSSYWLIVNLPLLTCKPQQFPLPHRAVLVRQRG